MANADTKQENSSLIDPVYQRFVRGVTRAIGSSDFYEFFMDAISRAQNEFQFSNRKLVKTIDLTWVDAVEDTLKAMQNIITSPRNVIKEEDLIVNVANARKAGAETVRHLAQHTALVDSVDAGTGEVRPGKLMQRYREESLGLYENRLVYTTLEYAHHFVKIRHDALFEAMSDEFGAKLKVKSDMVTSTEQVHLDMFLHIKEIDDPLKTDRKNREVFERISRMYRVLSVYMNSTFAQQMAKLPRVKGSLSKTNILKRNPDYKAIVKLWEFLKSYDDIGYTIRVVEQNPNIDERLQGDIYRNILFQYLILKSYLEDENDREIPAKVKERKRSIKPKFIREIIEELTEDYNLPDVEIRKVLIEELTKEQLMQEEAAERRRLVEEQARRKKEEEERIKAEKKAEQERIKAEKAAERERIRLEKEAEEQRKRQERMEQQAADRRYAKVLKAEIAYFQEHLEEKLQQRQQALQARKEQEKLDDYADAVRLLEEEARRKKEEAQRERQRKQDEKERLEREKAEEEARIAAEKEAEARRLAAQKEEEERIRQEQLRQQALECLQPYSAELAYFRRQMPIRLEQRLEQAQKRRQEEEVRLLRRKERQAQKQTGK